jgi:hypothetical protein
MTDISLTPVEHLRCALQLLDEYHGSYWCQRADAVDMVGHPTTIEQGVKFSMWGALERTARVLPFDQRAKTLDRTATFLRTACHEKYGTRSISLTNDEFVGSFAVVADLFARALVLANRPS